MQNEQTKNMSTTASMMMIIGGRYLTFTPYSGTDYFGFWAGLWELPVTYYFH